MIRLGTSEDLKEIMNIAREIKEEVKITDILKWDEEYPTQGDFLRDINNKTLYIREEEGIVKGFICINKDEHAEFEEVNWTGGEAMVVHRLAVKNKYRKTGIGWELLKFANDLSIEDGCRYLKTCIYEKNYKSHNLFEKSGFNHVGNMSLEEYEGEFHCYEKFVK